MYSIFSEKAYQIVYWNKRKHIKHLLYRLNLFNKKYVNSELNF